MFVNWWTRGGRLAGWLLGLNVYHTPQLSQSLAGQFVRTRQGIYGMVAKLAENYEMFAGWLSPRSRSRLCIANEKVNEFMLCPRVQEVVVVDTGRNTRLHGMGTGDRG